MHRCSLLVSLVCAVSCLRRFLSASLLVCVVLCILHHLMSFSKISKNLANELALVPRPRNANKNQKQTIPTVLDLTDATRTIMEQHISVVGLDKYLFQHTVDDQSNISPLP